MTEEKRESPFYTGMLNHVDKAGGYSIVISTEWHKIPLKKGMRGMMFSPYADDINTSLLAIKHKLKYAVQTDDLLMLRQGFEDGIKALPGAEVESIDASYSDSVNVFDARFTFLDGDVRRKRWVRTIYWGNGQLTVTAQGRTVDDFEYWLPMFYNAITTLSIL